MFVRLIYDEAGTLQRAGVHIDATWQIRWMVGSGDARYCYHYYSNFFHIRTVRTLLSGLMIRNGTDLIEFLLEVFVFLDRSIRCNCLPMSSCCKSIIVMLHFVTVLMIITGTGYIGIDVIFGSMRGMCTPPIFKCYKRPSFELKVHRNVWAAGALPRNPLRELTALRQTH